MPDTKEQEAQQKKDSEIIKNIERMRKTLEQGQWVPPAWSAWFMGRRK
jgi:hypothetical protein